MGGLYHGVDDPVALDQLAEAGVVYRGYASMYLDPLTTELAAAVERARTAWPAVSVDAPRFSSRLRELVGDQPAETVARLHVEDLYLAWACAEGNADALAAFDAHMWPVVDATLAGLRIDPAMRDDLTQDLRVHLIVGSDRGPGKLAQYRGQGDLGRWLRAATLRAAYRLVGKARRYVTLDETALAAVSVLDGDPALVLLKDHCRTEFKNAFAAALAGLPRRDRLLLKQHYLDQLTLEDVAALHKIHRSSAARWLAQARAALASEALREFRDRLRVSESEVESLVRLVRSQLDITLERMLGGA